MIISLLSAVAGAISLFCGKFIFEGEALKNLSGFCYGIGAAALSLGIGSFVGSFVTKKVETDETKRRKDIQVNDERNIRIKEKAAYQTFQCMLYGLSALSLILTFMSAPLYVILLNVGLTLGLIFLFIIFINYYSEKF